MPKINMILRTHESIRCSFLDGFLSSSTPQYMVNGKEIIPTQVIKVPKGMELSLSKARVSKEEPVTKSSITLRVKIRLK